MTVYSSCRATYEKMDVLHANLGRLNRELAEAWVSPDREAHVPRIEHRIRRVWDEMDYLAIALSGPMAKVSPATCRAAAG